MSIKTLRKRIALVAVSALGAGLLSIAPANAANFVADDLYIAPSAAPSTNLGACSIGAGGQSGVFVSGYQVTLNTLTDDAYYLVIAGPASIVSTDAASATPTTITESNGTSGDTHVIQLTGTGTVTVTGYTTVGTAAVDVVTITSVASCAANTLSVADSNFTITSLAQTDTNDAAGIAWAGAYNGVDTTGANAITVAGTGYMRAILTNAYGSALPSKPVIATATGNGTGCLVAVEDSDVNPGVAVAPAAQTAVLTSTGADLTLAVKAATTGEAVNCTVTLSYNGIVVGTKAFLLLGAPAKLTVSGVTVGARSADGYFRVAVEDSLGRPLPGVTITNSATEANNAASALVVSDAIVNAATTSATTDVATGAIRGTTPAVTLANIGANSVANYSCTAKGGAAKLTVRALVSGITYVTSAPFDVLCGGTALDKYTVSLDKALYAPGEVATLTVSGMDVDGFAMASASALTGLTGVTFPGMTFVTTPAATDVYSSGAGKKTYQLTVGTTEGSFVGLFKLTATTDTSAKTVAYKIAYPPTGAVSNAEVLAAIVKLIASINKQIAKLQKLIKK